MDLPPVQEPQMPPMNPQEGPEMNDSVPPQNEPSVDAPPQEEMGQNLETNGGNSEILDLYNGLSSEKQEQADNYIKSLAKKKSDDKEGMPMESKRNLNDMISEMVNNILDDESNRSREDKKIRNKKITCNNPFVVNR